MSEAPHTVKSYEEELKNLNANIIKWEVHARSL